MRPGSGFMEEEEQEEEEVVRGCDGGQYWTNWWTRSNTRLGDR